VKTHDSSANLSAGYPLRRTFSWNLGERYGKTLAMARECFSYREVKAMLNSQSQRAMEHLSDRPERVERGDGPTVI
jgi:hypothetical protein